VGVAALVAAIVPACAAAETYDPVTLTAAEILKRAGDAVGKLQPGAYIEVDTTHGGGVDLTTTTITSGKDVETTTTGGGFTWSSGSFFGHRWEQDRNGVVRMVSDFRANEDPNALALRHPEDPQYRVKVLGETQTEPRQYVIEANPPGGVDCLYYYDAATFLLAQTVSYGRDRYKHVVTYGDYRNTYGLMNAFTERYSDGRPENDTTTQVVSFEKAAQPVDLSIPKTRPIYAQPSSGAVVLPADFTDHGIIVRATVNGRGIDLLLDSGASGLLLDPGIAHDLGLTPVGRSRRTIGGGDVDLGSVRVPEMSIGDLHLHDVVFETAPLDLPGDVHRVVGLLGYDFIASGLLKIDFKARTAAILPRASFDPQALSAHAVPADLDDGVPRVPASMEAVPGHFLVDTGAFKMLVFRNYAEKLPNKTGELAQTSILTVGGPMRTQIVNVSDFAFGGALFQTAEVTVPERSTFDIADYDGIIGRDALSVFQLYFDYEDGMIYTKVNR
jgi:predicted aspartyl protease